jgi:hypothetical protein
MARPKQDEEKDKERETNRNAGPGRPNQSKKILIAELEKGGDTFEKLVERTHLSRSILSKELKRLGNDIERCPIPPREKGRGKRYQLVIKLSYIANSPKERILRSLESLMAPNQSLTMEEESKLRELLTDEVIEAMKEIYISYRTPPEWLKQVDPLLFKLLQETQPSQLKEPSPVILFILSTRIFAGESRMASRKDLSTAFNALPLLRKRKLLDKFNELNKLLASFLNKCDDFIVQFVNHIDWMLGSTFAQWMRLQQMKKRREVKTT